MADYKMIADRLLRGAEEFGNKQKLMVGDMMNEIDKVAMPTNIDEAFEGMNKLNGDDFVDNMRQAVADIKESTGNITRDLAGLRQHMEESAKSREHRAWCMYLSERHNIWIRSQARRMPRLPGLLGVHMVKMRTNGFMGVDYNMLGLFLAASRRPTNLIVNWADYCSYSRVVGIIFKKEMKQRRYSAGIRKKKKC